MCFPRVQEFYRHFQGLEGPKRLLGFSKAGKQHYASPGEQTMLSADILYW